MNYLRKTYFEINEDAIRYNIRYIKARSGKKLIAVIKANGYGTEDLTVARIASEEGSDLLAVSSIDEAMYLRKNGIETDILILGEVDGEQLNYCRIYRFQIVTVSKNYVLSNLDKFYGVMVHLKINTGMNRIGILPEEGHEVNDMLKKAGAVIMGIMTHYACSDTDDAFTRAQFVKFRNLVKSFNCNFHYIHSCNTDAALSFNDDISNCVRCGLGMLGYSEKDNNLKESLSLTSEVVNVKRVRKGEGISYGQHYISDGQGYILTLPIGYADGFIRRNTGLEVYINGEYGRIVGSICMDQLMVHTLTKHETGEKVELFGPHISLKKRSIDTDTIPYEIITNISDRVTRIFYKDGQVDKVLNYRFR